MVVAERWRRCAAGLGIAAAAVVALLRTPGKWTWRTIWAEDGAVYATDVARQGPWRALLRGYAGYVQLVPRLLAAPLAWLPVRAWAAWCAGAAVAATVVLAALVHRWMRGWVAHPLLRLVVPALVVLAPVAHYEVNANLANLGWALLVAAAWAVVALPRGTLDTVARVAVVVLCALSTTVAVLLVPFALVWAWWRRRDRQVLVVVAGLVAACTVQLALDATLAQRPTPPRAASDLPAELAVRVVGGAALGARWLSPAWRHLGWWLPALVIVVVVALVLLARPGAARAQQRALAAGFALAAVVLYLVTVWLRGTRELRVRTADVPAAGSRYDLVPITFLVTALVLVVDRARRRWLTWLVAAQAVLVIGSSLRLPSAREDTPFWSDAVRAAAASCASGAPAAFVPVAPAPDGWGAVVPCDRLR